MVNTKKRQPLRELQKETHGDQFFSSTVVFSTIKKKKTLELMKGEFVGTHKIKRTVSLSKARKCEDVLSDDDNDDDDDDDEDDDVDNDDPLDVVADNILPG